MLNVKTGLNKMTYINIIKEAIENKRFQLSALVGKTPAKQEF